MSTGCAVGRPSPARKHNSRDRFLVYSGRPVPSGNVNALLFGARATISFPTHASITHSKHPPLSMNQSPGLRRQLGLASAAAAVAGESIAVGIFLTPAGMAKSLGSPGWLLVVWVALGAMTLSGALCYGELTTRYPQSGGTYVYLREAFGPGLAFLYGWMCLLVLDPGPRGSAHHGSHSVCEPIFTTGRN